MNLWFTEKHTDTRGLTFRVDATLHHEVSAFQTMDIVETQDFGRLMLLDDVVMVTEKDEWVYHEMISHVALYTHPQPKNVLIIGGGDGGTLREVCRHPEVEKATLVEIDDMVIRGAKQFFPQLAVGFNSPQAHVIVDDGIRFIAESKEKYDIILIDSTDPVGPATGLFRKDFYQSCADALQPDGILAMQSESPYIPHLQPVIRDINRNLADIFPQVHCYLAAIQTYQAGLWSFHIASRKYNPINDFQMELYQKHGLAFQYYNAGIHQACFQLPSFLQNLLR
jgi:spermidine synthase